MPSTSTPEAAAPATRSKWPFMAQAKGNHLAAQNDEPERIVNGTPETWSNWTLLDAEGRALWVVYATSAEHALRQYHQPAAVSARPEAPQDRALSQRVHRSFGRLD